MNDEKKKTFVLVHGAFQGSWAYARVTPILEAQGHRVVPVTLTGLAERAHLIRPDIGLDTHIADVVNVIKWLDLSDIVLCGHSYGGMVVSGVVQEMPGRIASLVYLDAFVPKEGKALLDYLDAEKSGPWREAAEAGRPIAPIPAFAFKTNPADVEYLDRMQVPQPGRTLVGTLDAVDQVAKVARRTFVFAGAYAAPHFQRAFNACRADGTWLLETLPCGHNMMIDLPRETAAIIARS